jgi:DNA repair protein RadC
MQLRFCPAAGAGSVPAMSFHQPPPRRLGDAHAAGALFAGLAAERLEVLAFAYLDADGQMLGMRHAPGEAADRMTVPVRAVAGDALALDARGVVMAHNHPSGDPTPSLADREATRMLAALLRTLDVRLLDHLVVARGGTASFRAMGLL